MLTSEEKHEIEEELQHVPQKRGASIEALKIVQRHRGWVSDDSLKDIAAFLEMSPDELDNVATFYNLIYRKPVGKHIILMCDSISCWLMGYDRVREQVSKQLGIELGQTTDDNQFTLLPMPCLGACDHAPVMMIDTETYEDLDSQKVDEIIRQYRGEHSDGTTAD
jgi:NADH-quinone oxidoreductase subunit E